MEEGSDQGKGDEKNQRKIEWKNGETKERCREEPEKD